MLGLQRLDQTAGSRNKRRQLDILLTVTAPHERIVFVVATLLVLALFAWALFGRIEHGVTIDGVLIKPGPRYEVVSVEPGHVLELFVSPGDRVRAGDPIARQSVPELDREVAALRRRLDLVEREAAQGETSHASLTTLLQDARAALLGTEARRAARELIVAHAEGEVMTSESAPGEFVHAGASVARIRGASDAEAGPLQAVLRVVPSVAQRIRPGMRATVDVAMPGGGAQLLRGEVVSVTAGPLPKWLAAMRPATEASLHRIDITLSQAPETPVPNGTACTVRVVLGRSPPAALLVPGLS